MTTTKAAVATTKVTVATTKATVATTKATVATTKGPTSGTQTDDSDYTGVIIGVAMALVVLIIIVVVVVFIRYTWLFHIFIILHACHLFTYQQICNYFEKIIKSSIYIFVLLNCYYMKT